MQLGGSLGFPEDDKKIPPHSDLWDIVCPNRDAWWVSTTRSAQVWRYFSCEYYQMASAGKHNTPPVEYNKNQLGRTIVRWFGVDDNVYTIQLYALLSCHCTRLDVICWRPAMRRMQKLCGTKLDGRWTAALEYSTEFWLRFVNEDIYFENKTNKKNGYPVRSWWSSRWINYATNLVPASSVDNS